MICVVNMFSHRVPTNGFCCPWLYCSLTLGAEVSKLKAMLAAQRAASFAAPVDFQGGFHNHSVYNPGPFDPNGMPPFFGGIHRGQFSIAAMSDAGVTHHRGGDYESQVSGFCVSSSHFFHVILDSLAKLCSCARSVSCKWTPTRKRFTSGSSYSRTTMVMAYEIEAKVWSHLKISSSFIWTRLARWPRLRPLIPSKRA